MKNITARPYAASDFNACLSIFDNNVPTFFAMEERPEFCDFLGGVTGMEGFYLVLTLGDTVIACGGLTLDTRKQQASLSWGMVSRELHRKGLGTHLTNIRLAKARTLQNVNEVLISTSQNSSGFYEKLGFTVSKIMPNGFGPGLDRWEMELRIA